MLPRTISKVCLTVWCFVLLAACGTATTAAATPIRADWGFQWIDSSDANLAATFATHALTTQPNKSPTPPPAVTWLVLNDQQGIGYVTLDADSTMFYLAHFAYTSLTAQPALAWHLIEGMDITKKYLRERLSGCPQHHGSVSEPSGDTGQSSGMASAAGSIHQLHHPSA